MTYFFEFLGQFFEVFFSGKSILNRTDNTCDTFLFVSRIMKSFLFSANHFCVKHFAKER